MKGQFTIKYFIFREIGKIPCCPSFPCVVPKFPVFSPSGKSDNQIPCFPCALAILHCVFCQWCYFCNGHLLDLLLILWTLLLLFTSYTSKTSIWFLLYSASYSLWCALLIALGSEKTDNTKQLVYQLNNQCAICHCYCSELSGTGGMPFLIWNVNLALSPVHQLN